jgi:hypothetical protein
MSAHGPRRAGCRRRYLKVDSGYQHSALTLSAGSENLLPDEPTKIVGCA